MTDIPGQHPKNIENNDDYQLHDDSKADSVSLWTSERANCGVRSGDGGVEDTNDQERQAEGDSNQQLLETSELALRFFEATEERYC
jgi:hypothetical protein